MGEGFWYTDVTVPQGMGFSPGGTGHLLWLLAAAVVCVGGALLFRGGSAARRRRMLRGIAMLLLADELLKYVLVGISGAFWPGCLPLHLCSINIFVILADSIRPDLRLRELLWAVCMPGAFFALVFPGWAYLPMVNAINIHRFTAHILLLLYPILLPLDGFRPRFSRLLRTLPWCLPVLVGVYLFNRVYGTNFFFLAWAGEGNPLALFASWLGSPGYLLGIPVIAGACWAALYGLPRLARRMGRRA